MRRLFLAYLLGVVTILPVIVTSHGIPGAHSEGYVADVLVVDLNCDANETCVSRPANFVEYYGADWCEECPDVEQQLRNMSNEKVVTISHRPSSSDDFWLQASKERFLDVYGLWGYPTIAVDGHYIFAGPTQSKQLDSLLSEYDSNYSGITNVTINGSTISLDGNFTNMSIDIWTIQNDSSITNLVTNHTNYSESNIVDTNGDKLVIVLSRPGFIALISGSSIPANDYNPDGGIETKNTEANSISGTTVLIITILLLMISLPATYQLVQVMRESKQANINIENISIKDTAVTDAAFSNDSEDN